MQPDLRHFDFIFETLFSKTDIPGKSTWEVFIKFPCQQSLKCPPFPLPVGYSFQDRPPPWDCVKPQIIPKVPSAPKHAYL